MYGGTHTYAPIYSKPVRFCLCVGATNVSVVYVCATTITFVEFSKDISQTHTYFLD